MSVPLTRRKLLAAPLLGWLEAAEVGVLDLPPVPSGARIAYGSHVPGQNKLG